jgi:serine/threonine-protein kinase
VNTSLAAKCIKHYRITGTIGRGATGVVHRAIDGRSGFAVAIKTIELDLFSEQEKAQMIARFAREAEIGMRLDHPGIVKVLDFFTIEDRAALVMELIEGDDLARYTRGVGLGWQDAIAFTRQLLEALAYVHRRGVVHRDVKPANILSQSGTSEIKLTDFGIARMPSSTLTCQGDVIGTPAYMAPEQLQGAMIDKRTDIFSVGATLYALIAGRPPFQGSLATVMHQLIYASPEPLSLLRAGTPNRLDDVVRCAMAKDPATRFATAEDFVAALDETFSIATVGSFSSSLSDQTIVMPRVGQPRDAAQILEELRHLLDSAVSERVTDSLSAKVRELADALRARSLIPSMRSTAIDICVQRGLVPLGHIALEIAPIPGVRRISGREDFIGITALMGICRGLLLDLDGSIDPSVERLATALEEAVASFASSMAQQLASEDNPDIAGISASFMRMDVLRFGLEMLGSKRREQSILAIESLLVNQVMARVNATFRRYAQTNDMFARYEVAVFLTEIEELLVLAERLVSHSPEAENALHAVGRQTLAELLRNAAALAQSIVDELIRDVLGTGDEVSVFASRIKLLGAIYIFASRFREPNSRSELQGLAARLYSLTEKLAGEIISRLKDALVRGELTAVRAYVDNITALHELAGEVGWQELGRRLLSELRNHIVGDPALHDLFISGQRGQPV